MGSRRIAAVVNYSSKKHNGSKTCEAAKRIQRVANFLVGSLSCYVVAGVLLGFLQGDGRNTPEQANSFAISGNFFLFGMLASMESACFFLIWYIMGCSKSLFKSFNASNTSLSRTSSGASLKTSSSLDVFNSFSGLEKNTRRFASLLRPHPYHVLSLSAKTL